VPVVSVDSGGSVLGVFPVGDEGQVREDDVALEGEVSVSGGVFDSEVGEVPGGVVGAVQGYGIKNFRLTWEGWRKVSEIIRGCLPEGVVVTDFTVVTLFHSVLCNASGEVLNPVAYLAAVARKTPANIVKDYVKLQFHILLHERSFARGYGLGEVDRWRYVAENMQGFVYRLKISQPTPDVIRAVKKKGRILADAKYRVCVKHKYQIPTCEDCYTARPLTFKEVPHCGQCDKTTRTDEYYNPDNPNGLCEKCHPHNMALAEKYAIMGFRGYRLTNSKERQNVNV